MHSIAFNTFNVYFVHPTSAYIEFKKHIPVVRNESDEPQLTYIGNFKYSESHQDIMRLEYFQILSDLISCLAFKTCVGFFYEKKTCICVYVTGFNL